MFTDDVFQPYTDGLEIKTDDQRLAEVRAEVCFSLFLIHFSGAHNGPFGWNSCSNGLTRLGYSEFVGTKNKTKTSLVK